MTSPHIVIGVGGLLTAGKDVFADRLVEQHGFVKLGMSDVLAEALYVLNPIITYSKGWTRDYPDGPLGKPGKKNHTVTPIPYQDFLKDIYYTTGLEGQAAYVEAKKHPEVRRLLQALGTEVGRNLLGQDIWVDAAKKKILAQVTAGKDVVITGIRFPNELDMITKVGWADTFEYPSVSGTTVWVQRPGLPAPVGAHASEATLSAGDFEYVLENSGTIADLEAAADVLLEEIRDDFVAGAKDLFTNRSAGELA